MNNINKINARFMHTDVKEKNTENWGSILHKIRPNENNTVANTAANTTVNTVANTTTNTTTNTAANIITNSTVDNRADATVNLVSDSNTVFGQRANEFRQETAEIRQNIVTERLSNIRNNQSTMVQNNNANIPRLSDEQMVININRANEHINNAAEIATEITGGAGNNVNILSRIFVAAGKIFVFFLGGKVFVFAVGAGFIALTMFPNIAGNFFRGLNNVPRVMIGLPAAGVGERVIVNQDVNNMIVVARGVQQLLIDNPAFMAGLTTALYVLRYFPK